MNWYKKIILVNTAMLLSAVCFAQNSLLSLGIWDLTSISGSFKAGGMYGLLKTGLGGDGSESKSSNLYGGMTLAARSYFINPDYATLNAEAGYTPQAFQNQSVIYTNRYDVINTKSLNVNSTLFSKSKISLTGAVNLSSSYDSREGLTDVKSDSRSYAASMALRNKFIPLSFNYSNSDFKSVELLTNNTFKYQQSIFSGHATKSFRKKDRNELTYTHNEYSAQNYAAIVSKNVTDNLELYNAYNLDSIGRSVVSSRILGTQQRGTDSFRQVNCTEFVNYLMPYNLSLNGNYQFFYNDRQFTQMVQNTAGVVLRHRLYQSLSSSLNYQYSNSNVGTSVDQYNRMGIDLNYTKRLPMKGTLILGYEYSKNFMNHRSQDETQPIFNEPYVLSDNNVVLIKKAFVVESTIIVRDVTGTVVYQLNVDYVLISNNGYIEIRRISGGLISNNMTVYLTYSINQPGKNSYEMNVQSASANLSLMEGLLDFYMTTTKQDYSNIRNVGDLNLDVISSQTYGTRVTYKESNLGAEYVDYKSSVYPYKMARYFLSINGNLGSRTIYSFNANDRNYLQVTGGSVNSQYYDASGMIAYMLSRVTRVDFSVSYQKQEGFQNNLELVAGKVKLNTYFRGLNFTFGGDVYQRTYLSNVKVQYVGGYFLITKRF